MSDFLKRVAGDRIGALGAAAVVGATAAALTYRLLRK
jgi:hypothetical protein